MKSALSFTSFAAFILILGMIFGAGMVVSWEDNAADVRFREAKFQELVARGRTRTLERSLRVCDADYQYRMVNALREAHKGLGGCRW